MEIQGVALFLMNEQGHFFLVKELQDKHYTGKMAGMLGIPMETSQEDEPPDRAITRLILEEVGAQVLDPPTFIGSIFFESNVRSGLIPYTIHVFVANINPATIPQPHDKEDVAFYGWRPLDWLLNPPGNICLRREIPRLARMLKN